MDLLDVDHLLIGDAMLSQIFGNIGATGLSAQQVANMPGPWYYQQQAMAQQAAQGYNMSAGQMNGSYQAPRWMFDGVMLSVMDFANKIWPDDCADKTHFILKWSE